MMVRGAVVQEQWTDDAKLTEVPSDVAARIILEAKSSDLSPREFGRAWYHRCLTEVAC